MKSELINTEQVAQFPKLQQSQESGNIFLMRNESSGTLVHQSYVERGETGLIWKRPDWVQMQDFHGKIVLSNK